MTRFAFVNKWKLSVGIINLVAALCFTSAPLKAQIVVSADKTASILASALVGTGITILGPTLTCPGNANGTFYTTTVSPIGIPNGIVLTSGCAKDTTIAGTFFGVNDPSTDFASRDNATAGDADLTALSTLTTFDACVLEFDFKASGDTVRFNYVFGSEEYTSYTCTDFNDVFGFLISGGAYVTPTNLALVPGTSIPVCINSVNCGPTGGGVLATCTAMGPGSPFCAYYVDNLTGPVSPYVTYDGLTTKLTAMALVSPCDTYHLKLGVADATDHVLDSGVFIEGGSLTSNVSAAVRAVGASGLPYCIRGCAPGNFIFNIPEPRDTVTTVRYYISGTAVNGYDYATIPTSVTIPVGDTSVSVDIDPLMVPPAGPKVVTLSISVHDPCTGADSIGAIASLTILDSFGFRIITPDTAICQGERVDIIAVSDTLFDSILYFRWTPAASLSSDTSLLTTATPTVTTTYTLRDSTPPALGCIGETRTITISVYNRPTLTIDSPTVLTCVGVPVQLHVYAVPGGSIPNTYLWSPATDLSSSTIFDPLVTPAMPGDRVYTVAVNPTAVPGCTSTSTILVHAEPDDFVLHNPDTAICIGKSVQVRITGSDSFSWRWGPSVGVSDIAIKQPVITPTVTTVYTVTASYARCPDMVHSFNIEVDHPAPVRIETDTLCLGQTITYDFTPPFAGYYRYFWSPSTYVSNDTIANPTIAPTAWGDYFYGVTITPNALECSTTSTVNLKVTPNSISVDPGDTAICKGESFRVRGTSYPLFNYQWLPTAGVGLFNTIDPLMTPDTSEVYVVTATFYKCPDMHDTLRVDVQPTPVVFAGGSRYVCQFDTLHIRASVAPAWYTNYIYSWTPAASLDDPAASSVVFKGDSTTLMLTVTTPAGCKGVDSALIRVYPGNFASLNPPQKDFCPHDTFVLAPTGASAYRWFPARYLSDSMGSMPVITPVTSQAYTVVATSAYGCRDTLQFEARVHPGGLLFLGDSVTLRAGEKYQIQPQTNCTRFAWFPPAGLDNSMVSDPVASPQVSTKYIVKGYTEDGCFASDSINIYVDNGSVLSVPNAFTPGSGANNEFKIIKQGIATLNYFRIFNRWGNLVFQTSDIDEGWDGSYKGVPQPFGVFVYEIEAQTSNGEIFRKQGNLTLIR